MSRIAVTSSASLIILGSIVITAVGAIVIHFSLTNRKKEGGDKDNIEERPYLVLHCYSPTALTMVPILPAKINAYKMQVEGELSMFPQVLIRIIFGYIPYSCPGFQPRQLWEKCNMGYRTEVKRGKTKSLYGICRRE